MDDEDDDHGKTIVNHTKKTHNFSINISKGGVIGIGVGIIVVSGAFLLNAFLNRSPKKLTNKKHLQDHSAENTDIAKEKPTGSGVSREISAHKVFEDGDHKVESRNGEEDRLKCDDDDDQEITCCSKDSENQAVECNGCVVETDELSSSAITDPLLHQLTRGEADVKLVSCIGSIDHGDQEEDSEADAPKHDEDDDLLNLESIKDSKIYEFPEAVHEESNTSNAEILEENVCCHSDGSLNIKDETNATFEADQGDEDKIDIAIQTSEGKGTEGENHLETLCPEENTAQYDGLIDKVQIDGARGEIDHQDSNDGQLTTSDARVLEENELLEEPKSGEEPEAPKLEFEVETNAETEGIEEKTVQDSAIYNTAGEVVNDEEETQLDVHTNGVGEAAEMDSSIEHTSKLIEYHVIIEAVEDTNEEEIQHDVHTNAVQEATEIISNIEHKSELVESQVIEEAIEVKEEKEAQHDVNSESEKSSELIEIQTIPDQDHSYVSHQITTDNIIPQEIDQNNSSSESSVLLELNPTTGLIIDSKDVGIDLHSIEPVTEKDIIYQETDESSQEHLVNSIAGKNIGDGSQTLNADNVDESSEGSLVQAKDQTDKLQDNAEHVTLQKTKKEIHYKEIEDDDAISSENIRTVNTEKGVSNMNFFKKNDDEKTSLLMRKRGPMSALLLPLCYSCLIAVLAMVIYKIQGF